MSQQIPQFEKVGQAFINHYYSIFDTNRQNLAPLYQNNSLMTWEGEKVQGKANILNKLASLKFQKVKHNVTSLDCQPSVSGGIIVFVCGNLLVDDGKQPLQFSQMFHLMPSGKDSFFVTNDIFRLVYG